MAKGNEYLEKLGVAYGMLASGRNNQFGLS